MNIPDEAVEAATGVEIGDLDETVEAPWHLQPEEARRVLEAALPHILTHRAEAEGAEVATYTVEVKLNPKAMWLRLTLPTDDSKEAYRDAKQYAEKAQSEGRSTVEYRVVQTDADGAKIAQIVTPDGLGDLNPLNLLWIEKMEREDASKERT